MAESDAKRKQPLTKTDSKGQQPPEQEHRLRETSGEDEDAEGDSCTVHRHRDDKVSDS
jgi:hypothetical protein